MLEWKGRQGLPRTHTLKPQPHQHSEAYPGAHPSTHKKTNIDVCRYTRMHRPTQNHKRTYPNTGRETQAHTLTCTETCVSSERYTAWVCTVTVTMTETVTRSLQDTVDYWRVSFLDLIPLTSAQSLGKGGLWTLWASKKPGRRNHVVLMGTSSTLPF